MTQETAAGLQADDCPIATLPDDGEVALPVRTGAQADSETTADSVEMAGASLTLNEEDHLRIQVTRMGLDLDQCLVTGQPAGRLD